MINEQTPGVGEINVAVDCIFTVKLECQVASTGYSWALGHMPDSVNLLDISFESTRSHIVGNSETQVFTFVAIKKDQNYLEFNLLRPWEPEKVVDTKTYTLNIDEEAANDLQDTAGCRKFASFGDTCTSNGLAVMYMPAVVQGNPGNFHPMYMPPIGVKYMPPVVKYMGPPVLKYMPPVDIKKDEDDK